MIKRISAVLLVCLLCISFASCGKDAEEEEVVDYKEFISFEEVNEDIKNADGKKVCTLSMVKPVWSGDDLEEGFFFNNVFDGIVTSGKSNALTMAENDIATKKNNWKFEGDCEVTYYDGKVISIKYTCIMSNEEELEVETIAGITFDLETKERVDVGAFSTNKTDYVCNRLAQVAKEKSLAKEFEGTHELSTLRTNIDEENFYFTEQNMVLVFDRFAVTHEGSGSVECIYEISDIFKFMDKIPMV